MDTDIPPEFLKRLQTSEGHLRAILEMAREGRPCEEVLHQLNALQRALRAASCQLIHCQLRESQSVILAASAPGIRAAELKRLHSLYTLFTQFSFRNSEVIHE